MVSAVLLNVRGMPARNCVASSIWPYFWWRNRNYWDCSNTFGHSRFWTKCDLDYGCDWVARIVHWLTMHCSWHCPQDCAATKANGSIMGHSSVFIIRQHWMPRHRMESVCVYCVRMCMHKFVALKTPLWTTQNGNIHILHWSVWHLHWHTINICTLWQAHRPHNISIYSTKLQINYLTFYINHAAHTYRASVVLHFTQQSQ